LLFSLSTACGDPTGPTTPIVGAQLFNQYCARCHGPDGAGLPEQPGTIGRLHNPGVMKHVSDEAIMMTIRRGKPPNMPAFEGEFTEAKLMVLTAYVRSLSQPKVAPAPE